jgi:tyrosinase
MRVSFLSALAVCSGTELLASAAVIQDRAVPSLPPLPITEFKGNPFVRPLSFDELLNGATLANTTKGDANQPKMNVFRVQAAAAATCSNPRVRQEWDSYSNSDKQAFISAIRCLQGKPASGKYAGSKSKYDDLTALHQKLTPNVHSNAKFLLWHRYFVWTFEQLLRNQCGFNREMPWWDETKWSGAFSHSSVFSAQWFGDLANVNGGCVPNGVSHHTLTPFPPHANNHSNLPASPSTSAQAPATPARTACSAKATPP